MWLSCRPTFLHHFDVINVNGLGISRLYAKERRGVVSVEETMIMMNVTKFAINAAIVEGSTVQHIRAVNLVKETKRYKELR